MPQNFACGKDGKGDFRGNVVQLTSWTLDEGGTDADTTNSGTAGIETSKPVTTKYSGTCEGLWDLNAQPSSNPPRLKRGETGDLKLYVTPETYWLVPAQILTFSTVSASKDVVKFSFTFDSTGAVTPPAAYLPSSSSSSSSST